MSSVVDASVLVAAASDWGPEGVWAEDVLAGAGIVAPHLVLVEATNIVRRLERSRQLTQLEATAAVANYDRVRQAAVTLLTSSQVRHAFDVRCAAPRILARYGDNSFGCPSRREPMGLL